MRKWIAGGACALAAAGVWAAEGPAPVTAQRIVHAEAEPQNWYTTGRDYSDPRRGIKLLMFTRNRVLRRVCDLENVWRCSR